MSVKHTADDAWRQVLIREALQGFSDGFYDRLWEQAEIDTMGAYADWVNKNQGKVGAGVHPLQTLKGIGAAIAKVQAAEEAFWERVKQQPVGTNEEE
jgi:hypothetical protein